MRLKGKKVAVLAEEIYQEMELWVPYYRLKEEGAEVKIVAPEKKTYKSKLGYPVNADVAAADVSAKDFDAWGAAPCEPRRPSVARRTAYEASLTSGIFQLPSRMDGGFSFGQ